MKYVEPVRELFDEELEEVEDYEEVEVIKEVEEVKAYTQ